MRARLRTESRRYSWVCSDAEYCRAGACADRTRRSYQYTL